MSVAMADVKFLRSTSEDSLFYTSILIISVIFSVIEA